MHRLLHDAVGTGDPYRSESNPVPMQHDSRTVARSESAPGTGSGTGRLHTECVEFRPVEVGAARVSPPNATHINVPISGQATLPRIGETRHRRLPAYTNANPPAAGNPTASSRRA